MDLRKIRKENNLTQTEVANYIGITQNGYSMIENGIRKLSVDNAKLLGKIFHVDWWKFFED